MSSEWQESKPSTFALAPTSSPFVAVPIGSPPIRQQMQRVDDRVSPRTAHSFICQISTGSQDHPFRSIGRPRSTKQTV